VTEHKIAHHTIEHRVHYDLFEYDFNQDECLLIGHNNHHPGSGVRYCTTELRPISISVYWLSYDSGKTWRRSWWIDAEHLNSDDGQELSDYEFNIAPDFVKEFVTATPPQ
jgi:hypothetical protein